MLYVATTEDSKVQRQTERVSKQANYEYMKHTSNCFES